MEPSVVCLGITDAGRCCFDKTTASLAGCCGGITSSYIFQKHRALGHLARKWKFSKKKKYLSSVEADWYLWSRVLFKDLHSPDGWVFHGSDLLWWCQGFWIFPDWFLSYLSSWFLQNVINCERGEGLSWSCYGRAVTVAWSYRTTVCTPLHTTGQWYNKHRGINAVLPCFFCRLELKTQRRTKRM